MPSLCTCMLQSNSISLKINNLLNCKSFFLYITRDELNLVVLELKEDGTLHRLKRRWWQDKSQCAPDNQVCLYVSQNYTDIKFN